MEEKPIHLGMHLALLAAERFHSATGRWPGSTEANDQLEENTQVEEIALSLLRTSTLSPEVAECIAEV